jgi:hypothetical protein
MQIEPRTLYTFTCIRVDKAHEITRDGQGMGQKDEARDPLRFICNDSILQLLKHFENNGSPFEKGVLHLEWKLREPENDCHPSSAPDFKDDCQIVPGIM